MNFGKWELSKISRRKLAEYFFISDLNGRDMFRGKLPPNMKTGPEVMSTCGYMEPARDSNPKPRFKTVALPLRHLAQSTALY